MADIHTIVLTIVIEDREKWSETESVAMHDDTWIALAKVSDVVCKAACEYMTKHPTVYPNPEFNG